MSANTKDTNVTKPSPLKEITQPFIDLVKAPRAIWGINFTYFIEGFVYFGMLGYLTHYFTQYIGLSDTLSSPMVGILTWGITLSMVFLGGLTDRYSVRAAMLGSLALLLVGRIVLSAVPATGLGATGLWSAAHLMALGGIFIIVIAYGLYQPAVYAAVKQVTTAKTSAMGYAMLYALMNLGGWLPSFFSPVRKAIGISGAFWVYVVLNIVCLTVGAILLTKKVMNDAIAKAKLERERDGEKDTTAEQAAKSKEKFSVLGWLRNHPLADAKFSFFIFALIPVQTLFAHNWLTLPKYVERAFKGTFIGDNFEFAVNFNPLLIFILVPVVTALTQHRKIYNMVVIGTFVMAAPTFLLTLGASPWTLAGFLVLMTLGEAHWQPRFLQYAAEIAPPGRTGAYMGVAQFPWFLTKVITSLYAGWFLTRYCPDQGTINTEAMWFIYGLIAIASPVMLVIAKPWLGKNFKEKSG